MARSASKTSRKGGTDSRATQSTVIFLHIGKTGGTTLRKIIYRNYPRSEVLLVRARGRPREETLADFTTLPEAERARPRLIVGHTVFGLHELVPRPATYITMVRKPTSLALSQFAFVQRRAGHRHHQLVTSNGMSLEEYLDAGISMEMDNGQTRAIAGDLDTPYGQVTEQHLERAKENLDRHFAVAGLTERFDESLIMLKLTLGWHRIHYVRANVSPRSARPAVPPATLRRLEEQNRFDVELYRYVNERFDRAAAEFPTFRREAARFERTNRLYRPWGNLRYTYPQRLYRGVVKPNDDAG
jgi:hypothetical protein